MSSEARPGTEARPLRVAVVGSGPAGFFGAKALLASSEVVADVDVLDRLPTPYGLVRGGVAPDHQRIKRVTNVYDRAAEHPRFRFLGNVEVGVDVGVDELREHYDQILFAVGNEGSRRLGIPGEGLWRAIPAAVIVGWYNGHPDYAAVPIDLTRVRTVAVVGNGNVSVDVARVLVRDPDELARTDVSEHALATLRGSAVREVVVLGRRGPANASFTPAELRELAEAARPVVDPAEIAADPELWEAAGRDGARNRELMGGFAAPGEVTEERRVRFRFRVSPTEILGDDDSRVRGIRLRHNRLEVRDGRVVALPTDELEDLDVDMVVVAVGYAGKPITGLPFDAERRRIPNTDGRVVALSAEGAPGAVVANTYVAGWARTGPRGLLGSHKRGSAEVVAHMLADLRAGDVPPRELPPRSALLEVLEARGTPVVGFDDWQALDAVERARGERRGAPRDKLTDVAEMLDVARKRS